MDLDDDAPPELIDTTTRVADDAIDEDASIKVPITIVTGKLVRSAIGKPSDFL
jgi:hypothetical protein